MDRRIELAARKWILRQNGCSTGFPLRRRPGNETNRECQ
jgi:hypothetical protein